MQLSVIILNYNVSAYLELCVQSVQAALKTIESEIIVVDNHSSDDSCSMIRLKFPEVVLICNSENLGFSKGNNLGVKTAKGSFICILNPDTVVGESCFSKILHFASNKENLGAIGCRLIDGGGQFLPESKRNVPTPLVALKKMIGYSKDYYNVTLHETASGACDILVGAFMLMKRDTYLSLGGFDEDYFMYGEDIDLSYRLLKSGLVNYYFGETSIIHFKGESTLKDVNYAKRFYGAMEIFYKKHFKNKGLVNLCVTAGIKLAYALRSEKQATTKNWLKAYYIGRHPSKQLELALNMPLQLRSLFDSIESESLVIFDSESCGYEAIINFMSKHSNIPGIGYRIRVKNANFILGSDSSLERGQVLNF